MEYRINLTDDTVEQLGRVLGEPIQELEQEILDKEETIAEQQETIAEKDETIAEKQAIIDAFPTIESKSITANGTYSEEGKAYSPVVVNVPQTTVEALNVTQNGTYEQAGKAYSPVTVNVPSPTIATAVGIGLNFSALNKHIYVIYNNYQYYPMLTELSADIAIYQLLVCTANLKTMHFGILVKAVDDTPISVSASVSGWDGATAEVQTKADGYTYVGVDIRNVTGNPVSSAPISVTITPQ